MGMSYSRKYPNGRFKFERSGFLGHGDTVRVYKDGEKIDEFELNDSLIDLLKDSDVSSSQKRNLFESACHEWWSDYGTDL